MTMQILRKDNLYPFIKYYLPLLFGLIGYLLIVNVYGHNVDFTHTFLPAGQAILEGQFTHAVDGFYNPPWLLIGLVPFALLPEHLSINLFTLVNITCFYIAFRRFGANTIASMLCLFSPFVFY